MFKKQPLFFTFIFLALLSLSACQQALTPAELGVTEKEYGEIQNSIQTLEQQISKDHQANKLDPMTVVQLARAYEKLGQPKKAIQTYEAYPEISSKSQAILNNMAILYEDTGKYEKAIEYFKKLIDDHHENQYLLNLSRVYIQMKNLEQAESYYKQWTELYGKKNPLTETMLKKLREK